ncbi:MAG TPA: L-seryl-tRNA(Sec) selenium transferase [Candidatus Dormibacteraeota bacterium]|nr:L-seryl-tRNA(Sec) selenium transferase [Candidatus Dormibacteraeota bacterium]
MSAPSPSVRELPSVDRLAAHPLLARWAGAQPAVVRAARAVIDEERAARRGGGSVHGGEDALAAAAAAWLRRRLEPGPRRVLNATGVVVHTNLGRAPLGTAARDAVAAASGYTDLEYDLGAGARGSRHDHVAPLLATLCGAEDALVTTNNAAAVLLALSALCRGREVLVSRGEAVEIGGGFRIPEVMRLSGARMVDVGTTNRTRAADYAAAVTSRTAAIVRVHPSNFAVVGFTERATTAECAAVAREHGLLLLEDAGSGALRDPARLDPALAGEPVLEAVLAAGADLVTASGDKLCGGPQAGLVAGRAEPVSRMRRHPLMRAVRPDKMVLAALGATLAAHLGGTAEEEVPVARMLARTPRSLEEQAGVWASRLRDAGVPAEVAPAVSEVGGGSLPGSTLPTTCVTLPGPTGRLLAALRAAEPPVIARAAAARVWLDPRTVAAGDMEDLLGAVAGAWAAVHGGSGGAGT